jgi:uncharacterized membrane protein
MIEWLPAPSPSVAPVLVLRPRRALNARQFVALFAGLAAAIWGVALLSWWQGNAYAPAFALLDCSIVALCLRRVWRSGERAEWIALDPSRLEVRRDAEPAASFAAHPYWVRVTVDDPQGESRVSLGSQGRRVRVGDFLSPDERRDLARRLRQWLAEIHRPPIAV